MAKYGKKAQDKVEKTMHELKKGTLKSSSGEKVTNPKQAIAIGLSQAKAAGGKVPEKKGAAKKAVPKKAVSKKSAGKKAPAKKATTKTASKKTSSR